MRIHLTVTVSRDDISCDGAYVICQLNGRGEYSTVSKDCKRNEKRSSYKERKGNALALGAEEGRG